MSRRAGIRRTTRLTVDGDPTHSHRELTAEVHVQFPPDADHDLIARAVIAATEQVLEELRSQGGYLLLAPLGLHPAIVDG